MITKEVELLLNIALKEALNRRHEYVLMEHVLYAVCSSSYGRKFLEECGTDIEQVFSDLENYFSTQVGKQLKTNQSPLTSVMVERTISRAVRHSLSSEQEACDIPDILVSMMEEKESYCVFLLQQENVSRFKIIKQLSHFQSKHSPTQIKEEAKKTRDQNLIQQFLIDLRLKARGKKIDPLIGRENELEQMINILARRKKNNVILVGDPGVGKTALVEGMVLKLEEKQLHSFFNLYQVYSLDLGSLLSGTKFRGDFEERIKKMVDELKKISNGIIFIDEIHMLIGAGATNGSQMDASNLLKSMLAEGDIRVIGTTTHEEYRQQFQKDHALSRRFEKINLLETDEEETINILNRLKNYYEKFHQVEFPKKVIDRLPQFSKQYFPEKNLPDGAIDLLDLAGASLKLKKNHSFKAIATLKQIEVMIYRLTGIPIKKIETENPHQFKELEKKLKNQIFGQNQAVETMVKAIKLAKSGLIEKDKTMGAFLFSGPTGVGKTELCKVICEHLGIHLIRLDMSEFLEAHSGSKLIGAPPGYIGYNEKSGELTEQVKKHPYSLILLDEIEKAHPDVLNLFLQVMDHGHLKDSSGHEVNFEHTLIVMTSNLGAKEMSANPIGFIDLKDQHYFEQPIRDFFSPEFRNRISKIVYFNFLQEASIKKIIDKLIKQLNQLLVPKKVTLELDPTAIDYLVEKGSDLKMGARPIKRIIDQEIKEKLIDELLFGRLNQGGKVLFSQLRKKLKFSIES